MHGATDETGRLLEPGWIACDLATTRESTPGRSWRELGAPVGRER
jgi:hypothetical protein